MNTAEKAFKPGCSVEHSEGFDKEAREFWKDIIYNENLSLNEEQVLKELTDFYFVMREVPLVYMSITGGICSKVLYYASTVIEQYEKRLEKELEENYDEAYERGRKDGVQEGYEAAQADFEKEREENILKSEE